MTAEQPGARDRGIDYGDRRIHRLDNSPTLTQFQTYVADREVRYFIEGERQAAQRHVVGSAAEITAWVQQNFTPVDVGGTTVYDLSSATGR